MAVRHVLVGSRAVTTAPLAFGESPPLLGMLTVPARAVRTRGVVICGPFGQEGTHSYRPLRTLGQRIAADGVPVLRFDWPGSGDSGDDETPVEDAAGWSRPVREAVEALREAAGVDEVALVGLRIGATIAALAALEEPTVSELVVLAPYASGRTYLDDLRAFNVATSHVYSERENETPSVPEGGLDASGFLLTASEVGALEAIDLTVADFSRCSVRRALVVEARDPSPGSLGHRLDVAGLDVTRQVRAELPHVWDGTNISVLPRSCERLVRAWLGSRSGVRYRSAQKPGRVPRRARVVLSHQEVHEEAIVLETTRGPRYAIACEPAERAEASDKWVVLLNGGRVRKSGPNRLWTTYARRWAHEGLPSLRLDVWGAGESGGSRVLDELRVHVRSQFFPAGIGEDIADALTWLATNRDARRFALVGMCSSAYWAFQTALADPRVAAQALVNVPTLYWDGRTSLLEPRRALSDIRRIATTPRLWRHAVRAGARPPLRELLDEALDVAGRRRSRSYRPRLHEALSDLAARGTETLFVFSGGDRGLGYLERHIGPDFREVLEGYGMTTEVVEGPDHTFRPLWSHDVLRRALEAHLERAGFVRARLGASPLRLALEGTLANMSRGGSPGYSGVSGEIRGSEVFR